jgi:hypothetical protein
MRTINIDLAAYLHLAGIEPAATERQGRTITFTYADTRELVTAVAAFSSDALVPVRAFSEARHEMKQTPNGVRHFRTAIEQALDAAVRGERRRR